MTAVTDDLDFLALALVTIALMACAFWVLGPVVMIMENGVGEKTVVEKREINEKMSWCGFEFMSLLIKLFTVSLCMNESSVSHQNDMLLFGGLRGIQHIFSCIIK